MTLGEKIKYCRKKANMTQLQLAELSGIHPVSIRKYETNAMEPKPENLKRIADALNINYLALSSFEIIKPCYKTTGDLLGIIMLLCNLNIMKINGEYGEDDRLKSDTVSFQFNPQLSNLLESNIHNVGKTKHSPLSEMFFIIKDNDLLQNFINWEHLFRLSAKYQITVITKPTADNIAMYDAVNDAKEKIEIDLMSIKDPIPQKDKQKPDWEA